MALKRLTIEGYGVAEWNKIAAPFTAKMESQLPLDPDVFKANDSDASGIFCEVGQFLALDKTNMVATVPTTATDADYLPIGYNFSSEVLYDERKRGLKNFKQTCEDFLPNIGIPEVSDVITINAVLYDDTEFAAASPKTAEDVFIEALEDVATTPLYGILTNASDGFLVITDTVASNLGGIVYKVVEKTTMPDGSTGIKLQAVKA